MAIQKLLLMGVIRLLYIVREDAAYDNGVKDGAFSLLGFAKREEKAREEAAEAIDAKKPIDASYAVAAASMLCKMGLGEWPMTIERLQLIEDHLEKEACRVRGWIHVLEKRGE